MKQSVDEFLASQEEQSSPKQTVDDFLGFTSRKQSVDEFLNGQQAILKTPTQVTQSFGTVNPIEPTAGHKAGDTNYAAQENTPVSVPQGQWYIQSAYNQADPKGAPGNYTNQGYGNDVIAQNTQTGEKLHFLHLAGTQVKPGDIVSGNTVVGTTGNSGNSTGPNLGVEYYDPQGNIGDFEQSPYAQYIK